MSAQDKKEDFEFFDIDEIDKVDKAKQIKDVQQSKVSDKKEDVQLMEYSQSTVNVKNQSLEQSGSKGKVQLMNITQSINFSIQPPLQSQTNLLLQSDSLSISNNNRRGEGRRLLRRQNQNNKTQPLNNKITQTQPINIEAKTQKIEQQATTTNPAINNEMTIKQTNDHLDDQEIRNLIHTGIDDHKNTQQKIQEKPQSKQIKTIQNKFAQKSSAMSEQKTVIIMTESKQVIKSKDNHLSLLDNNSDTANPIQKFTKSQVLDHPIVQKDHVQKNAVISGSNTSSVNIKQRNQTTNKKEDVQNQISIEVKTRIDLNKSNMPGIKCSVLQMLQTPQKIKQMKFSISQLTSALLNSDWLSSPLPNNSNQIQSVTPLRYYGFSQTDILFSSNNQNQQKYNRQLLLGTKSKLKREIIQQNQNQKQKVNNKKSLFLYLEHGLTPITQKHITLKKQASSDAFNFIHKMDFQHRLNIVVDLLQNLAILHKLNFTLFPNQLFPSQSEKSVLYMKELNSKHQFQPHLKLTVHLLQSYKQHIGNSTKTFDLKTFIASYSKVNQIKNNQTNQIVGQKIKKQPIQSKIKQSALKGQKSPQIRFYHEEWYWKIWYKLFEQFTSHQFDKTSISDLVTPIWIDLFQIPFDCLKLLYGEQLIQKLTQKKYEFISKEVQKILSNQKLRKQQKTDSQIIKICQKPLIQWNEYEKLFKQEHQKLKKPSQNKKSQDSKIKQKDFVISIIKHPDSKRIFEQIVSCLNIFPIHELSKQKYEIKRLSSLSVMLQKLRKFKSKKRQLQITPPLIKLENKQTHQNDKQKKKANLTQKGLTILSSQSTRNQIIELKNKYFELLRSANTIKKQQFQNQHVKKLQTHLLTNELKKKLNTVFSSHNGIMKIPKSYTLIYKSSVFNFSVKKFYQFCQNRPCLLYIMKVKDDRTFYYFNEEKIIRSRQLNGLFGGYVKDNKGTSFIYTGDEVLKVKNPTKSFAVSHLHGPIIGQGDVIIKQGNLQNECHHPKSYQQTKKSKKLLKSTKFQLEQMDVYEVIF